MKPLRGVSGGPAAERVRAQFRRGGAPTGPRVARTLGEPALLAILLSAVGSSIYYGLGIVAGDALGLTPLVFLLAGVFFVITMLSYVEGNSLHPERGGASTFARYAFDELWSFIAGWAIILDYLIVLALAAFAVSDYVAAFWHVFGERGTELVVAGAVLAFVAFMNIRGITAQRLGGVLRLNLLNIVLFGVIIVAGFVELFDAGLVLDSIDLGQTPTWRDLIFAAVVATVACTGIEAASGLAGDIKVGRRGLRRVVVVGAALVILVFGAISVVSLMALPIEGGTTPLGERFAEAPVLGVVEAYEPEGLAQVLRFAVGAMGALILLQAANGQMLGLARLMYSLATNRQVPSLFGRLHETRATPYVSVSMAAVLAFCITLSADLDFMASLFAFGAMLSFTIAHLSVIVLRFREPDRPSAFRVPMSIRIGRGSIPLPAALGAVLAGLGWLTVVVLHEGARVAGGVWMAVGIVLYVTYRRQQGKSLRQRFTIPAEALQETHAAEYGSILVPLTGHELDDDIVGTAGRLAAEQADDTEGGAVLEALYVFEIPMSLPLDARVPDDRVVEAKRALKRAKAVGEEYDGVEVATAMVRGRTAGQAIVAEARRRGVEAIVLAAEEPSRVKGGALLGGRGAVRDRFVGETTRYVVEKAPCKVLLTAPPAHGGGVGEGVAP